MINYFTVREIACLLKVNIRTVYLWIEQGVLKSHRFINDKSIYIDKKDILSLIKNPSLLDGYTFTIKEICTFLDLKDTKWFLERFVRTDKLKAQKVGGKYLVLGTDLEIFLNEIYRGNEKCKTMI